MLYALLVEHGPVPPTEHLLEAHREWLFPRFREGSFLLSGTLDAPDGRAPTAIALFEAENLDAATALLDTEPLYAAGACTHRIVAFTARVRASDLNTRFPSGTTAIELD
jgi:uncharacterized protein YciI